MAKKLAKDSPLALAHAKRSAESARIAKMSPAARANEIAPVLMDRAIKAIRGVGRLGTAKTVREGKDGNEYSPKFALTVEQRGRILSTLRHEVEQLDAALNPGESGAGRKKSGFSF